MPQKNLDSVGSARTLTGVIYPLTIFISDKDNTWPSDAKNMILQKRTLANDWLTRQATFYGVDLRFLPGGSYGYIEDVVVDYIPISHGTGEEYSLWVEFLLRKIGWNEPQKLYDYILSVTFFTNLHVEIYANSVGRGYAMAYRSTGINASNNLEGIFCYRFDSNKDELSSYEIAHEVLHLYGAWDLYQTFEVSKQQEQQAERFFSYDIMHRYSRDIEELIVGPLTAWRIGWTNSYEPWYEFFRPGKTIQ